MLEPNWAKFVSGMFEICHSFCYAGNTNDYEMNDSTLTVNVPVSSCSWDVASVNVVVSMEARDRLTFSPHSDWLLANSNTTKRKNTRETTSPRTSKSCCTGMCSREEFAQLSSNCWLMTKVLWQSPLDVRFKRRAFTTRVASTETQCYVLWIKVYFHWITISTNTTMDVDSAILRRALNRAMTKDKRRIFDSYSLTLTHTRSFEYV